MKKNLFIKNKKIVNKKFFTFDGVVLLKSITRNFQVLPIYRLRLGFLAQLVASKKGLVSVSNIRSQCFLTWRTGSVCSFFKLTRLTFRENFSFGLVKGLRKSS
jgi:ribosomal protein S14